MFVTDGKDTFIPCCFWLGPQFTARWFYLCFYVPTDFYNAQAAILCSGRTRNIFYDDDDDDMVATD